MSKYDEWANGFPKSISHGLGSLRALHSAVGSIENLAKKFFPDRLGQEISNTNSQRDVIHNRLFLIKQTLQGDLQVEPSRFNDYDRSVFGMSLRLTDPRLNQSCSLVLCMMAAETIDRSIRIGVFVDHEGRTLAGKQQEFPIKSYSDDPIDMSPNGPIVEFIERSLSEACAECLGLLVGGFRQRALPRQG